MEKTKTEKTKFDLGSKNVRKTFLSILIPTLIAQVIAGTFVVFDTFFVSKGFQPGSVFTGIGEGIFASDTSYAALGPAAISYAMPYTFFIIGVGLAIGAGLSSIMTKQLANNDKVGMQKTMDSFLPMSVFYGVIVMVILLIFAKVFVWAGSGFQDDYLSSWFDNPLMNKEWVQSSYSSINGHLLSQASWYLRIQAIGTIPYIYMSAGVIMLRVQGKAQYATSFSAVGLVTNIVLDFTLICILKMNVVGAAIATVIGQYATAAVYWYYFKYRAEVKASSFDFKTSLSLLKETFVSGVSIMMLQVLTGVTLIMFTFTIGITNYGQMYSVTNYTSVYQGYNALFIFCNLIIIAAAQSMKPIVEYNYLKGDIDNVKKARNWGYGFAMIFAIIVTVFIVIFAKQVIGLFYSVNGSSKDLITAGWLQDNNLADSSIEVYTDGMNVAKNITALLFISFPIAACIQMSGTYIQSLGQDSRTSIMLFGKLGLLFPLILFFGFAPFDIYHADWGGFEEITELQQRADLDMFLALPVTDLLIGALMVYFLVDSERKLIRPKQKDLVKA